MFGSLAGDAKLTLAALSDALAMFDLTRRLAARPSLEARISHAKAAYLEESADLRLSTASPLRPERVMQALQMRLTADTIVVADASYSSIWITNYLTALRPGMRFLTPRGLAGLGWGLPMALGANWRRPKAPVFCLAGDGALPTCGRSSRRRSRVARRYAHCVEQPDSRLPKACRET